MKEITLKRLGVTFAAALALWVVLALTHRVREDRMTRFTLPGVDTAAVDTIGLVHLGDSAMLVRGPRGWTVNGHSADTARVHELLTVLVDTSTWGELVAESRASHARLGVDADSGRRVRVQSHGKTLLEFTAGKATNDWGGIHVRRGSDSAVYALHGLHLRDALTRSADDWRDKRIASIVPDSVTAAEVRRGSATVSLRKEGGRWVLAGGGADSSAVASLLEAYRDLNASGFATASQVDSLHFAKPRAGVRFRGKGDALIAGLVFDSTAGGVWARADSGGTVFRLDAWQLARLAPAESTLKTKKKK
jgi:hypothetical protein